MNGTQNVFYQRGLRKLLTTPTEVRAIPTTEEVTMTHVGEKAKGEAGEVGRSKRRTMKRQQLSDIIKFKEKRLSEAERQGRAAAAIELGNIALTGYGGYRNIKQAQKQTAMLADMQKLNEDLLNVKKRYYERLLLSLKP